MKTKRTGLSARLLGAFLIGAIALPGSAAARPELGRTTLRPELSPKVKAGIEEDLRAGAGEGSAVSGQGHQRASPEGQEAFHMIVPVPFSPGTLLEQRELRKRARQVASQVAVRLQNSPLFLPPSRLRADGDSPLGFGLVIGSREDLVLAHSIRDQEQRSLLRLRTLDLYHVLENAVDAIADRAAEKGRTYRGRIEVTARRDGEDLVLEVSDNGIGIPEVIEPWIFRGRVTTKEEGTRAGGKGAAMLGMYGFRLLKNLGGGSRLELETLRYNPEETAEEDRERPWGLVYDPSREEFLKREGSVVGRSEAGTTVRWRFSGIFSAAGAEEAFREYQKGLAEHVNRKEASGLIRVELDKSGYVKLILVGNQNVAFPNPDPIRLIGYHPEDGLTYVDIKSGKFAQATKEGKLVVFSPGEGIPLPREDADALLAQIVKKGGVFRVEFVRQKGSGELTEPPGTVSIFFSDNEKDKIDVHVAQGHWSFLRPAVVEDENATDALIRQLLGTELPEASVERFHVRRRLMDRASETLDAEEREQIVLGLLEEIAQRRLKWQGLRKSHKSPARAMHYAPVKGFVERLIKNEEFLGKVEETLRTLKEQPGRKTDVGEARDLLEWLADMVVRSSWRHAAPQMNQLLIAIGSPLAQTAGVEEKQEERLLGALLLEISKRAPRIAALLKEDEGTLAALRKVSSPNPVSVNLIFQKVPSLKSLQKGEAVNVAGAVEYFQKTLDPQNPRFSIQAWARALYTGELVIGEEDEAETSGRDFLRWVDLYIRAIEPDFRLTDPPEESDAPASAAQIWSYNQDLLEQVLFRRRLMVFGSRKNPGEAVVADLTPLPVRTTPAGRQVPVYLAEPARGEEVERIRVGGATANYILLFKSGRELDRNQLYAPGRRRWLKWGRRLWGRARESDFKFPDPSNWEQVKGFFWHTLSTWGLGRYSESEFDHVYTEDILPEELAHSDTRAFGDALMGHREWNVNPEETVTVVKKILREGGVLRRNLEALQARPMEEQFREAKAIMEVEGWLATLRDSPEPAYKFLAILRPGTLPGSHNVRAAELLLQMLRETLFADLPNEAEGWRLLMREAALRYEDFSQHLRIFAHRILDREFLPHEQRIAPRPWRPHAAGLEEVQVTIDGSQTGPISGDLIQRLIVDDPQLLIPKKMRGAVFSFLTELMDNIHKYGYPVAGPAGGYAPYGDKNYRTTLKARRDKDRLIVTIEDQTGKFQLESQRKDKFEPYFYEARIIKEPDYQTLHRESGAGERGHWGFPMLYGYYHLYEIRMKEEVVPDVGVRYALTFPAHEDSWWNIHWKIQDVLKEHPEAPLVPENLAHQLQLDLSTLEQHDWRFMVERENLRREGLQSPKPEIQIAAGAEEEKELRGGSWTPISFEVRDFPKADWDSLMESVDRFLRGTTSLERSLERSALSDTQLYGIPRMMSALKKQANGDLRLAAERISLALDWATVLRARLYPNGTYLIDADDLFLELLWKGIPLAGEAAPSNGDFLENLNSLTRFLLNLHDEIPENQPGSFSSIIEPILSYYAAFPPSMKAGTLEEFSEDLEVLETAALNHWNLDEIPPMEFSSAVWRFKKQISAAGAEERVLEKEKLWNQNPHFLAAVDYFNRVVLRAKTFTPKHLVGLFRLYRGEPERDGLRRARIATLRSLFASRTEPLLEQVNAKVADTDREKVLEAARDIYNRAARNTLFLNLDGFTKATPNAAASDGTLWDSPHPASGHHRAAWFMMNWFLIKNGFSPFYFASPEEYTHHVALLREKDGKPAADTELLAWLRERVGKAAGAEEKTRVEETLRVPVADQLVVGTLAHSPGIRELQASLRDSGVQVKEVKNPRESAELLRAELVGLLILAPEDSETGDWRGGTAVPTVVLPAFVAAGLTEREMAALAAEARVRGRILYINGITREGAEGQILVLRMA